MTFDITSYRLHNQRISQADLATPTDVVSWFGAVQSQDFLGASGPLDFAQTVSPKQMLIAPTPTGRSYVPTC